MGDTTGAHAIADDFGGVQEPPPWVDDQPPTEPDQGDQMLDDIKLNQEVSVRARFLKVDQLARERLAKERAEALGTPSFDAGTLAQIQARPRGPKDRVEGLIPAEAGSLVVAQRKTGKTTFELNLAAGPSSKAATSSAASPSAASTATSRFLNFEVSGRHDRRLGQTNTRSQRPALPGQPPRPPQPLQRPRRPRATRQAAPRPRRRNPHRRSLRPRLHRQKPERPRRRRRMARRASTSSPAATESAPATSSSPHTPAGTANAPADPPPSKTGPTSIITLVRDKEDDRLRFIRAEGRDILVEEDQLLFDQHHPNTQPRRRRLPQDAAKVRKLEALKSPSSSSSSKTNPACRQHARQAPRRHRTTPLQRRRHQDRTTPGTRRTRLVKRRPPPLPTVLPRLHFPHFPRPPPGK